MEKICQCVFTVWIICCTIINFRCNAKPISYDDAETKLLSYTNERLENGNKFKLVSMFFHLTIKILLIIKMLNGLAIQRR